MMVSPKLVTRLIDYTFEIDAETAAALRWQFGGNQAPIEARFSVACRGEQDGKGRKWTPHFRRIVVNGEPRKVPAEYGEDGVETAPCARSIAEEAVQAICERYLSAPLG
jgi:hypothetical protein